MSLLLSSIALMACASMSHHKPSPGWDWNVIIGTGQSLAVGGNGFPPVTTTQPFGNLMLASGDLLWPVDPNDPKFSLVPLIEPCGRRATGYPSAWPTNLDGETAHSGAANQMSELVRQKFHRDYVSVHFEVGEAGQGMVRIRKDPIKQGVTGRAYEASIIQTKAIDRLAKASNKTYGVGAIFMTHGETDTGNAQYEDQLYKLWSDYNGDLKAITGQKSDVLMIVSQHNRLGEFSPSTIAQWKIGDDHPESIVCAGPKYQYAYGHDSLHMTAEGYRLLGEKYGEVYFERVVLGKPWRPLEPIGVTRNGSTLTVKFHVPNKPLIWDSTLGNPHPSSPEWSNGKGLELTDNSGKRIAIQSANLKGADTVELVLAADPGADARLSYALVGEPTMAKPPFNASPHWGLLRDSDPFVGYASHTAQPNFCVAFELKVP
jgi:hypothetical protein